ncbi:hypothetical protein, partial [Yersinia mollaretii]|uniref:hypothetical protein n=1 Tax=Yersinia mollaretii TaxID=33060 RepID=UPI001C9431C0
MGWFGWVFVVGVGGCVVVGVGLMLVVWGLVGVLFGFGLWGGFLVGVVFGLWLVFGVWGLVWCWVLCFS